MMKENVIPYCPVLCADFHVPYPSATKPIAIAKRNIISHIRSPEIQPRMSSRKKPAPMAKYHQAKSRARSRFPMVSSL